MSWVLYIQVQNFWFLIVFRRLLSIFNSCHLTNRGSVDSATSQEKDRTDFSVYPVCLLNRLSALDRWNGDFTVLVLHVLGVELVGVVFTLVSVWLDMSPFVNHFDFCFSVFLIVGTFSFFSQNSFAFPCCVYPFYCKKSK